MPYSASTAAKGYKGELIMKIQIVYYSRYGSAKEIAYKIKDKLKADSISDITDLKSITGDLLIVGSSIYAERPDKKITDLLLDKEGLLKDKKIALFVVCLAKEAKVIREIEIGGPVYLRKMEEALNREPVAKKIFGGKLIPSLLSDDDYKRQEAFYKRLNMPFNGADITSEDEIDEFIREIKAITGS
jgi:menaquinone-dependent protoporphyrinogen oxidase